MKFCTGCGRQCMDNAVICPACGNRLSAQNKSIRSNKGDKKLSRIILVLIASGIMFLIGRALVSGGNSFSQQQSDMDVAVLGGTYTYLRTEQPQDNVIDVYYQIDNQNELLKYSYECQLRYMSINSEWQLQTKKTHITEYSWLVADTTWVDKHLNVYIKDITKDTITLVYNMDYEKEPEVGEETISIERISEDNYFYIDEAGILCGTVNIASEILSQNNWFYLDFGEEPSFGTSSYIGHHPFNKVENGAGNYEELAENEDIEGIIYFEINGMRQEFPCTPFWFYYTFGVEGDCSKLEPGETRYMSLEDYDVEFLVKNQADEILPWDEVTVMSFGMNEDTGADFSTIRGIEFGMSFAEVEENLKGIEYEYREDDDGYTYILFEYFGIRFHLGSFGENIEYIALTVVDEVEENSGSTVIEETVVEETTARGTEQEYTKY